MWKFAHTTSITIFFGVAFFPSLLQSANTLPQHGILSLTLQERVECQTAIDSVYWQHRIWQSDSGHKPALSSILPAESLQAKVEDSLKKSNALETFWNRPLSSDQLQAEIQRMVSSTKDPKMLHEIFTALQDDPYRIAECLARPLLADRLIRNWYATDDHFHGELRARAELEMTQHGSASEMSRMGGRYEEITWVHGTDSPGAERGSDGNTISLSESDWETLADRYQSAKTGKLGALQEDADRFYVTAVLEKNQDSIKVATVSWDKIPFDRWWMSVRDSLSSNIAVPVHDYSLPRISTKATDIWGDLPAPPNGAVTHSAVWTGAEMIIWGGFPNHQSGFRYNPSTDTWSALSTAGSPPTSAQHTAVWTGRVMIVWGGYDETGNDTNAGGIYDPLTDHWKLTSTLNAPSPRFWHSAVWTGSEMIVWGGSHYDGQNSYYLNSGARFNPKTNTWTPLSSINTPSPRYFHTAVWTGSTMIIWGGFNQTAVFNTGGIYNPATNTWNRTSTLAAPLARAAHNAVWTGTRMIIWGGYLKVPRIIHRDLSLPPSQGESAVTNSGGIYNPINDTWQVLPLMDAPTPRALASAIWTGTEMIVWGGAKDTKPLFLNTGGKFNPASHQWTPLGTIGAPEAREFHTAVWTGTEMIVWGGLAGTSARFNSGGRYNLATDSWIPTNTYGTPTARWFHSAVWTGTEMIVWGGLADGYANSGSRYDPATDTWVSTSTSNAPAGRRQHTAVWTGNEMIVWGGTTSPPTSYLTTGGRYNPATDTWLPTAVDANTPGPRTYESAIWTGSEMIIWGGFFGNPLQDGARYNPSSDSWLTVPMTGAPEGRRSHTAVWNGNEMIVWGGYTNVGLVNTGARYNPTLGTWTSTAVDSNTPAERQSHTAVWTGSEMIVWGGVTNQSYGENTGGRYNPATDTWTATNINNAPDPRTEHTAVWTGNKMVVWGGGILFAQPTNTGGSYDPSTDSWTSTNLIDAPWARKQHTAIWTGQQMIVWGGFSPEHGVTNTGAGYVAP